MSRLNNTDRTLETARLDNPPGFVYLLSTPTIFDMDMIGKNLQMNGIDVQWIYADTIDAEQVRSTMFVKKEQREQAQSIITSLDLLDFTITHGK